MYEVRLHVVVGDNASEPDDANHSLHIHYIFRSAKVSNVEDKAVTCFT